MDEVWLELNGRQWHVNVGTAEHENLVKQGAIQIDGPDGEPSMPETRPLSEWTVAQLKARAKVLDLDVGKRPKQADLVAAITAAEAEATASSDHSDNDGPDGEPTGEEGEEA